MPSKAITVKSVDGRLYHNGQEVVIISFSEYVKAIRSAIQAGYRSGSLSR